MVGPPPVAKQRRARAHQKRLARAHVEHQNAGKLGAVGGGDEVERAVIFQPLHIAAPDLLGQPVDDLDAGQIAFMHGAVEGLPGEGLLVHGAVGIAVEEAAEFGLQFADAARRGLDQQPGEILVVEPAAAFDGVHEMPLDRVRGRQRDVVAALHHAGAAAFAEQAFDRDGDVEFGIGFFRVQRGEQPGAAGAEDQNVGFESRNGLHGASAILLSALPPPLAGEGWGRGQVTSRRRNISPLLRHLPPQAGEVDDGESAELTYSLRYLRAPRRGGPRLRH